MPNFRLCPLCGGTPIPLGTRYTDFSDRTFHYGYCAKCHLGLVLDPRTDYENLYDAAYYSGDGADALVDYCGDDIGRHLEFEGLQKTAVELYGRGAKGRWFDFGGGLGQFAAYLRGVGWDAWACDEGHAAKELKSSGLYWDPSSGGEFDIISAIEVVEHLVDPLPVLAALAGLLAPGGTLLITTGNLDKAPSLSKWKYAAAPEVHVTFWTPRSWGRALSTVGLTPTKPVRIDPAVTQYKIIKNLPVFKKPLDRSARFWRGPARLVDRKYGVSAFPVGRKPTA